MINDIKMIDTCYSICMIQNTGYIGQYIRFPVNKQINKSWLFLNTK